MLSINTVVKQLTVKWNLLIQMIARSVLALKKISSVEVVLTEVVILHIRSAKCLLSNGRTCKCCAILLLNSSRGSSHNLKQSGSVQSPNLQIIVMWCKLNPATKWKLAILVRYPCCFTCPLTSPADCKCCYETKAAKSNNCSATKW